MNAKRSRDLNTDAQRWGAGLVAVVIGSASRTVVSRLRSSSTQLSRRSASSRISRVPSFRAQLRLAQHRRVELRVMSPLAALSNIAVASSSSLFHHRLQNRCCPLPNKALVPTAKRLAPFGPRAVSAAAAQRRRYAERR